jgi:hypothetical protein
MSAIVHNNFRVDNANRLIASFSTPTYIMLGKSSKWDTLDTVKEPTDTVDQYRFTWRNAIGGKKITSSDARNCIQYREWTTGTIYTQYDSADTDLFSKAFYVVIPSTMAVYKCIFNNFGAPSTTAPSGTSTATQTLADGYKWKYMFTVANTDMVFVNTEFIPATTNSTVASAAVVGTIDSAVVLNGGFGYTEVPSIQIIGDGTGAVATGVLLAGSLQRVTVTGGTGYSYAEAVITGTGTGASCRFNISPVGGHGSDAVEELGGYFVGISKEFYGSESGTVVIDNDFRSIALMQSISAYGTNDPFVGTTANACHKVYYTSPTSTFILDADVTIGTAKATIVYTSTDGTGAYMLVNNVVGVVPTSGVITSGAATASVSSVVFPQIKHYSGKVLYIEQRQGVSRAADQIERISLVLEY